MICRPVLVSCYGGTEGIRVYIQKLKDEFSDAMYMCGARKVSDIKHKKTKGKLISASP